MSEGIVLVLGGGGARGLAHIGVLEVLQEAQIPVRAVAGTSIGAEVGAFLAAGVSVGEMRQIAMQTDWLQTMRFFTPDFGEGGISSGKGIRRFLEPYLDALKIEELDIGYAAVTTDLETGELVVLNEGSLLDAVCASIAFPGLLSPSRFGHRVLADGGLVNPVPFDVARDHFGGPVLAVYTHPRVKERDLLAKGGGSEWQERLDEMLNSGWLDRFPPVREWLAGFKEAPGNGSALKEIGVSKVINRAQLISEDMLVQLRSRINPPDLHIAPAIHDVGLFEFYRAADAIEAGNRAAREALPEIEKLLQAGSGWWPLGE